MRRSPAIAPLVAGGSAGHGRCCTLPAVRLRSLRRLVVARGARSGADLAVDLGQHVLHRARSDVAVVGDRELLEQQYTECHRDRRVADLQRAGGGRVRWRAPDRAGRRYRRSHGHGIRVRRAAPASTWWPRRAVLPSPIHGDVRAGRRDANPRRPDILLLVRLASQQQRDLDSRHGRCERNGERDRDLRGGGERRQRPTDLAPHHLGRQRPRARHGDLHGGPERVRDVPDGHDLSGWAQWCVSERETHVVTQQPSVADAGWMGSAGTSWPKDGDLE